MASQNRIVELASLIHKKTVVIDDFLTSNGSPTPSFNINAPIRISIPEEATDIQAAHSSVIEATAELQALLLGPAELLQPQFTDLVSLKAITRFKLDKAFPVGEEASIEDISKSSGLDERNLRRLLRHGMTRYLFREPRKGVVAHTALTKLLAEDDLVHDSVANALDEVWPAAVRATDAMAKWPGSEEPNQTGFSLANGTDKSMWEIFAEDQVRGQRFARAMSAVGKAKGYEPHFLLEGYPWESIGNGIVVDVGGSHGSVAISIATRFPRLKCVVQDIPAVAQEGRSKLPADLSDRVTFMAHDFFTEQPVVADLYYFRSIFHNWSDKYSIRLLRQLIPALKRGSRILVNDVVLPEPNTLSALEEKKVRYMDIIMLQLLNSYQRDEDDWRQLFRRADHRFKYLGSRRMPGAVQSIIEASWEG